MKPGPLFFAVALVVYLVMRRRRLGRTALAGGVLAAIGLGLYSAGVFHLPNLQDTIQKAGEALGSYTYVLVGVMAYLETGAFVGLIAPGEFTIILGGVVAGQGKIDVVALIAIVWVCAVAGDVTSLYLGRRLGRAFLERHGSKVQITPERLAQVERFFDRHGGKAIFLGRFVGLVRAIAPFLAGSSRMPLRRFLPYDVLGAGLWGTTFVLVGYAFWQSFDQVVKYAERGALALGTTITVVVTVVWSVRWLREEGNRERAMAWMDRQLQRPALRPVARVLGPVLRRLRRPTRFVWNRVTPGDLGLELTTLLAIFAVATFVFFALVDSLGKVRFTSGDLQALRLAHRLRDEHVVSIARTVTDLGSLPVTGGLVLVTAIVLLMRRRALESVALASGMALTYIEVHVAKVHEGRPRPSGALVDTMGSSFPSGHAAYAVAWVAVAVALARVLPGVTSRAALITIGLLIGSVVAATRIYLRAHFLSDVVAGAALGAAAFSLAAMVARIVAHLRHNPSQRI